MSDISPLNSLENSKFFSCKTLLNLSIGSKVRPVANTRFQGSSLGHAKQISVYLFKGHSGTVEGYSTGLGRKFLAIFM